MSQISAYIASRNAKESDIHQFGLGQRKRRTSTRHARAPATKKARSSSSSSGGGVDTLAHDFKSTNRASLTRRSDEASVYDECDELAPSAGAIKANKSTTTTTSSRGDTAFEFNGFARVRQFNLERLFGIFGQVATICGVHMTSKPVSGSHSSVKGSAQDHILTTSERASLHITDKSSSTSSSSTTTTTSAAASSSSSVVGSVCEGLVGSSSSSSSSSSVYDTMSVHMTMEEIARAYGSTHLFTMVSWLT